MFRLVQLAVLFAVLGHGASAHEATPASPLSAADLAFIDRVTWGANEATAAEFQALGRDRWLERQLHPAPQERLPAAAEQQISATLPTDQSFPEMLLALELQSQDAYRLQDPEQKKAALDLNNRAFVEIWRNALKRSLFRYLYSADQLREKMSWFWFNHFNIHLPKSYKLIGDYEGQAVRANALGRFRDLLAATAMHPAMLHYLDNEANAKDHLNENFAREIMELHTMGVGSGYTQQDVQELALILTGVGINLKAKYSDKRDGSNALSRRDYIRNGLFEFNPDRHDYHAKHILGHTIDRSGFAEVDQALDILASHPATAAHISRKIATFFVSDTPPEALVMRMAQAFKTTDGDIASVLLVLFKSPEFLGSLPAKDKFKDPMQFVLSAVRLVYDTQVVSDTRPVEGWLNRLGEGLYFRDTPDGYPLTAASWSGPGQMVMRFEVAKQIGSNSAGLFKRVGTDGLEHPTVPQIQGMPNVNVMRQTLSASTRAALEQAKSAPEWNTLFLASPEFMHY
jgi:uncharacterized protein (DUF1800 family)